MTTHNVKQGSAVGGTVCDEGRLLATRAAVGVTECAQGLGAFDLLVNGLTAQSVLRGRLLVTHIV